MNPRRRFSTIAISTILLCILCGILLVVFGRSRLTISWPHAEREGGQILVNDRPVELTDDEPIHLALGCFASNVRIVRHGFEPIDVKFEAPHFFARRKVELDWRPTLERRLQSRLKSAIATVHDETASGETRFRSSRRTLIDVAINAKTSNLGDIRRAAVDALSDIPHPLERGIFNASISSANEEASPLWTVGSRRLRHSGPAWKVAVSPDGRWVASGSEDATVAVFDARTGQRIAEHLEHKRGIISLAVHPDSRRILTCGYGGRVVLFDVETTKTALLADRLGLAQGVAFSTSGNRLAFGGKARFLRVVATDSRQVLLEKQLDGEIQQVAFLDDDTRVAALLDDSLVIVDLEQGEVQLSIKSGKLTNFEAAIDDFEILDGGKQIALRSERQVVVLQVETGREVYRYNLPPKVIGKSSSPKWLAEFQIRVPKNQIRFKAGKGDPFFIPIGKRIALEVDANEKRNVVAIGTAGGGVFIFRTDTQELLQPMAPDRRWLAATFDATGDRLILGASNGTLAIVDCYHRRLLHCIDGSGLRPRKLLFSAATNTLWVEDESALRSYSINNPGEQRSIAQASGAALSADGKLLAYSLQSSNSTEFVVEELASARERFRVGIRKPFHLLVLGPDGEQLYGATRSGELFVVEEHGVHQLLVASAERDITALAMIDDENLAIASGKNVMFFNLRTQEFGATVLNSARPIRALVASKISDTWFCIRDGVIQRYAGVRQVGELRPYASRTRFSSSHLTLDDRFIAITTGDGRVSIYSCDLSTLNKAKTSR